MSAVKKLAFAFVKSVVNAFTHPRSGESEERTYTSRINGRMSIKSGGSAYLGTLTLVGSIGDFPVVFNGIIARIRTDGLAVLEPKIRDASWFKTNPETGDSAEMPGAFAWDFVGDDARHALFELACKTLPELRKREKSARAELAKRAA